MRPDSIVIHEDVAARRSRVAELVRVGWPLLHKSIKWSFFLALPGALVIHYFLNPQPVLTVAIIVFLLPALLIIQLTGHLLVYRYSIVVCEVSPERIRITGGLRKSINSTWEVVTGWSLDEYAALQGYHLLRVTIRPSDHWSTVIVPPTVDLAALRDFLDAVRPQAA